MCVHVCTYVHTHVPTHEPACTRTCVPVGPRVCMCMHGSVCLPMYGHIHVECVCACMGVYMHVWGCAHVHVCACTHVGNVMWFLAGRGLSSQGRPGGDSGLVHLPVLSTRSWVSG